MDDWAVLLISCNKVVSPVTEQENKLQSTSCLHVSILAWHFLYRLVRRSSDQSWGNLVHWWEQLCLGWKRRAGYAVVSNFETIEAKPLPPGTSAQLAELIALTRALELGKGKRIAIYTDSKYAFLVLHAHATVWKERGHLTTRGSATKYGDQILWLLEAVHLPIEVSVSHCKKHQKGNMEVVRGNQAADQAAKRAALQNNDLIGVATLVPQTNLPETPSYTEGKSEGSYS